MTKFMIGASAGGHTNELLALMEESDQWTLQPTASVITMDMVRQPYEKWGTVYVIGECDRKKPLRTLAVIGRAFALALRERPSLFVTTGSAPMLFFGLFVRLFGGRFVWIDSAAQIDKLSMSGRLARHLANRTLAQWEHIAAENPGVEYRGELV